MVVVRVCFVSLVDFMYDLLLKKPDTKTGGAELQQLLLSRAFLQEGMDVEFLVPAKANRAPASTTEGIRVNAGISPARGLKYIRALSPVLSTIRSLRRINADLYYMWLPGRGSSTVALYCILKRIPYVFAVMSNMDVDGTAEARLGKVDRLLYRFAVKHAALVTAETRHELDLLQENFGRKGMLVRNLCPVPEDADAETKRDIILWVGSFRGVKRPGIFVDLAARMPEYTFVMVGGPHESNTELYSDAVERARELPNLNMTGQLSLSETAAYYKKALLLVLTSSSEGFPNVMLEAWRVGTPAVSTFDPDGMLCRYGLGCYCEDADGLEAGVRTLMADDDARLEIGARAIKYVREHHDPDRIAGRVMECMREIVQGRR